MFNALHLMRFRYVSMDGIELPMGKKEVKKQNSLKIRAEIQSVEKAYTA